MTVANTSIADFTKDYDLGYCIESASPEHVRRGVELMSRKDIYSDQLARGKFDVYASLNSESAFIEVTSKLRAKLGVL